MYFFNDKEKTNVKDRGKAIVLVFDDLKEAYQYISSNEIQLGNSSKDSSMAIKTIEKPGKVSKIVKHGHFIFPFLLNILSLLEKSC